MAAFLSGQQRRFAPYHRRHGVPARPDCRSSSSDPIHKSFGEVEVLKGVSLTAHEGEVVVAHRPSGSGKSTLLRCINMLEVPTAAP